MEPNGVPQPTIGRIVIYRDEDSDIPGIVTAVHPEHVVSLTVFPPADDPSGLASVPPNDPATGAIEPGTWRWPVRG